MRDDPLRKDSALVEAQAAELLRFSRANEDLKTSNLRLVRKNRELLGTVDALRARCVTYKEEILRLQGFRAEQEGWDEAQAEANARIEREIVEIDQHGNEVSGRTGHVVWDRPAHKGYPGVVPGDARECIRLAGLGKPTPPPCEEVGWDGRRRPAGPPTSIEQRRSWWARAFGWRRMRRGLPPHDPPPPPVRPR